MNAFGPAFTLPVEPTHCDFDAAAWTRSDGWVVMHHPTRCIFEVYPPYTMMDEGARVEAVGVRLIHSGDGNDPPTPARQQELAHEAVFFWLFGPGGLLARSPADSAAPHDEPPTDAPLH